MRVPLIASCSVSGIRAAFNASYSGSERALKLRSYAYPGEDRCDDDRDSKSLTRHMDSFFYRIRLGHVDFYRPGTVHMNMYRIMDLQKSKKVICEVD